LFVSFIFDRDRICSTLLKRAVVVRAALSCLNFTSTRLATLGQPPAVRYSLFQLCCANKPFRRSGGPTRPHQIASSEEADTQAYNKQYHPGVKVEKRLDFFS
jgi:hypothetical protein